MDDLTAFLAFVTARLDEDEAAARAAGGDAWRASDSGVYHEDEASQPGPFAVDPYEYLGDEGVHIALHDPARVLREAGAKRAILDEHHCDDMGWCARCQTPLPDAREDEDRFAPVNWPCPTVRITFAVYGGYPDYRAEWKP